MRQFGVYRNGNGASRSAYPLLLNMQSDLISETGTRVVVPLAPVGRDERTVPPLMPHVSINGKSYVLVMPLIAAAGLADLGALETDLSHERDTIMAALDFLVSGI